MSSGSKKPQRRFQFIDNTNVSSMGANSTQVRRHVMQEYMREKRWEARTQSDDGPGPELQNRKKPEKSRSNARVTQRRSKNKILPALQSPKSESDSSSTAT